jgi:signal transduction histidine kinase
MFLEFILTLLLVRQLRKTLQKFHPLPKWEHLLTWVLYGVVVLFILQQKLPFGSAISWIFHLLLIAIIVIIFKRPELVAARNLMIALLPLVAVSIFTEIFKSLWSNLYIKSEIYLNFLFPIAITWLVAMLLIFRKQQKALEKEHIKRLEEEEQNQVTLARKAELEILVAERTAELTQQKEELEHALLELKSTQAQLVQKEKMASLGELTAGIAHEIQNPLNFVNNFSEVNTELLNELEEAILKSDREEIISIAADIKQNLQKINHHGKRADAIVKGMLQHSRISSGKKEPTDINALADEYLRLSYHGLRAKDKSFNANFTIDFDESLSAGEAGVDQIEVVPQDIGRVLLNLFTNAFYSVNEKKKGNNFQKAEKEYQPTVSVSTKKIVTPLGNGGVKIRVADNGTGIPQKVVDKIFQPFFTTKPTGQGTGLGLSLSYDIIKAHGGDIKVETKEGEGAEFLIQLPFLNNT